MCGGAPPSPPAAAAPVVQPGPMPSPPMKDGPIPEGGAVTRAGGNGRNNNSLLGDTSEAPLAKKSLLGA
jgi:hypothetical protein